MLALILGSLRALLDNDLLFPTFTATVTAFVHGVADGTLVLRGLGLDQGFC